MAFFKDVKWKNEEKYKLNPDIEIDESWVEETIDQMVEYASKESHYTYERKIKAL